MDDQVRGYPMATMPTTNSIRRLMPGQANRSRFHPYAERRAKEATHCPIHPTLAWMWDISVEKLPVLITGVSSVMCLWYRPTNLRITLWGDVHDKVQNCLRCNPPRCVNVGQLLKLVETPEVLVLSEMILDIHLKRIQSRHNPDAVAPVDWKTPAEASAEPQAFSSTYHFENRPLMSVISYLPQVETRNGGVVSATDGKIRLEVVDPRMYIETDHKNDFSQFIQKDRFMRAFFRFAAFEVPVEERDRLWNFLRSQRINRFADRYNEALVEIAVSFFESKHNKKRISEDTQRLLAHFLMTQSTDHAYECYIKFVLAPERPDYNDGSFNVCHMIDKVLLELAELLCILEDERIAPGSAVHIICGEAHIPSFVFAMMQSRDAEVVAHFNANDGLGTHYDDDGYMFTRNCIDLCQTRDWNT